MTYLWEYIKESDNMNNNLKPSEKVCSPFMYYCQKVIPLAFDESMSYYEQLCNLVYYLKNTVMPAVNNNADALTEVQNAFKQLEKYVDDYFKRLMKLKDGSLLESYEENESRN